MQTDKEVQGEFIARVREKAEKQYIYISETEQPSTARLVETTTRRRVEPGPESNMETNILRGDLLSSAFSFQLRPEAEEGGPVSSAKPPVHSYCYKPTDRRYVGGRALIREGLDKSSCLPFTLGRISLS